MGERITSKHFKVKRSTFGGNTDVDFKPNVAHKTKTAPGIEEHYIDDETGDVMLILDNGNITSQSNYELMWGKLKKAV